jgi:hypothetical protein
LHVHRATGAPYWPILACGGRVRVKTGKNPTSYPGPGYEVGKNPIFWKIQNKYISTGRIQTKFSTRKRLNTRSISLRLICGEFWGVQEIFKIFSIWNTEYLAKRWVKYTIVLVCVMLWRHLTPRSKGYFLRISTVVFVLKGGKYSLRYLYRKQLSEKYDIYRRTIKSFKQIKMK